MMIYKGISTGPSRRNLCRINCNDTGPMSHFA